MAPSRWTDGGTLGGHWSPRRRQRLPSSEGPQSNAVARRGASRPRSAAQTDSGCGERRGSRQPSRR